MLVSIITPIFNGLDYFLPLLDSVLNQSFKDFEWIIVDDCSTDGTFDFVMSKTKNIAKITVIRNDFNGGTARARNAALKIAKGKYVTFLDCDDLLDENYLASQVEFIQNNGPIITAAYRRITNKSVSNFIPRPTIDYKGLLKGNDASCLTTMYDRTIIKDCYFPENLQIDEDYVFWLEILKRGYSIKTNPNVIASYRIHKASKNNKKIKLIKPMFCIYYKNQKLGFFKSLWYLCSWIIYGLKKYKKVK